MVDEEALFDDDDDEDSDERINLLGISGKSIELLVTGATVSLETIYGTEILCPDDSDDFLMIIKDIYIDMGLKCMTYTNFFKIIQHLCGVRYYEHVDRIQVYLDLDMKIGKEFDIDLDLLLELHQEGNEAYDFGIQYLLNNPLEIWEAPSVYSEYKDLILELIEIDHRVLDNMPDSMKNIQLMESVATKNPETLKYFPHSLIESSTTVMNQLATSWIFEYPELIKIIPDSMKDDPVLITQIVRKDGSLIEYASKRLQSDDTIMQIAIEQDTSMIQFASEKLQKDVSIVSEVLSSDIQNLKYIRKGVISSHPELLSLVVRHISSLKDMKQYLVGNIDNKECMLIVVTRFGKLIEHVSDRLKHDLDIIKAAIITDTHNLKFVPDISVCHNDQYIQDQIRIRAQNDIRLLKYASDNLRSNSALFLKLLKDKQCDALLFLSETLKNDKQFIIELYTIDSIAITYASKNLLLDKLFMKTKVEQRNVQEISRIHPADLDIHKTILDIDRKYFEYFNKDIRDNNELVEYAVQAPTSSFLCYLAKYLSEQYRSNQDLMLRLIKIECYNFKYISQSLKSCKTFVMKVIDIVGHHIEYLYTDINSSLKHDKELILLATSKANIDIQHVITRDLALEIVNIGGRLKSVKHQYANDKEIVLLAVTKSGSDFQYASDRLKSDEEIIRVALQSAPSMIKHLSYEDKQNEDFCKMAVVYDGSLAQHVHSTILANKNFLLDILKLCQKNVHQIMSFVPPNLKKDQDIVIATFIRTIETESRDLALREALKDIYPQDPSLMILIVQQCPADHVQRLYKLAKCNKDKEFVVAVLNKIPLRMTEIDQSLRNDPTIIELVQRNK
jgi:hypothetical protein